MRKTRQQLTIEKLWKGLRLIDEGRIRVIHLNDKGKQFDYCTSPKLADVTDRINVVSRALNSIVYQEK